MPAMGRNAALACSAVKERQQVLIQLLRVRHRKPMRRPAVDLQLGPANQLRSTLAGGLERYDLVAVTVDH